MKKEDEWVPIPGMGKYEINLNFPFTVRNTGTGRVLKEKDNGSVGLYTVTGHPAKSYRITRLAYCAMHGLNPEELPKDAIIRMDGETPVLRSRKELSRSIILGIMRNTKNSPDPVTKYKKEIEFAEIVIRAHETGDFKPVSDYLFAELHGRLVTYFTKTTNYALPYDEAESFVTDAILLFVKRLEAGFVVCDPYNYTKGIAVRVIKMALAKIRRLRSYTDAVAYREVM